MLMNMICKIIFQKAAQGEALMQYKTSLKTQIVNKHRNIAFVAWQTRLRIVAYNQARSWKLLAHIMGVVRVGTHVGVGSVA